MLTVNPKKAKVRNEQGVFEDLMVMGGSGEKLTADETVLASGTIPTGTAQWKNHSTGLTVADLRKWKVFALVFESAQSNNYGLLAGGDTYAHRIAYCDGTKIKYIFVWLDSDKTVLMRFLSSGAAQTYAGNAIIRNVNVIESTNGDTKAMHLLDHIATTAGVADSAEVKVYNHTAQTADALWVIRGLIK